MKNKTKKNQPHVRINEVENITKEMIINAIEEFNNNQCDETFIKLCYYLRSQEVYFYMQQKCLFKYPTKELPDDYFKENEFILESIPVIFDNKSWVIACPNTKDLEKQSPKEGVLMKTTIRNLFREFHKHPIDGGIIYDYWNYNLSFDQQALEAFEMLDEFFEEGKIEL